MKFPFFSRKRNDDWIREEIKRENDRIAAIREGRWFRENFHRIIDCLLGQLEKVGCEYTEEQIENTRKIVTRIYWQAEHEGVRFSTLDMRNILKVISHYADDWRVVDNFDLELKLWIHLIPGVNAGECICDEQFEQLKRLENDMDVDEARSILIDIADMFYNEKFL